MNWIIVHQFFIEPEHIDEAITCLQNIHSFYSSSLEDAFFSLGAYNSLVLHAIWKDEKSWEEIKSSPDERSKIWIENLQSICFQANIIHSGLILEKKKEEITE